MLGITLSCPQLPPSLPHSGLCFEHEFLFALPPFPSSSSFSSLLHPLRPCRTYGEHVNSDAPVGTLRSGVRAAGRSPMYAVPCFRDLRGRMPRQECRYPFLNIGGDVAAEERSPLRSQISRAAIERGLFPPFVPRALWNLRVLSGLTEATLWN